MKVYVYKEYNDDLAYGEELVKVFTTEKQAKKFLKKRILECERCSFAELKSEASENDTVTEDYVSIETGDGSVSYYIIEESEVVPEEETITAFKAFNEDMTCLKVKFEEGSEYTTKEARESEEGYHACEHPLGCYEYYTPANSVIHMVEMSGSVSRAEHNSGIATTKIKIGPRLTTEKLVDAALDYVKDEVLSHESSNMVCKTVASEKEYAELVAIGMNSVASATTYQSCAKNNGHSGISCSTGDYSTALSNGCFGVAASTGDYSASKTTKGGGAAIATSFCSAACTTGDQSISGVTANSGVSMATGDNSISGVAGSEGLSETTGYGSVASVTEERSVARSYGAKNISCATGEHALASANGMCNVAAVTGYNSTAEALTKGAIAVAFGHKAKARGVKDSWLTIAEWEFTGGAECLKLSANYWALKDVKTVQVDGSRIKENVWYRLEQGEFVIAEEIASENVDL